MTHSPLRRFVHLLVPALLIAAMLAVLPAVTKAAPAQAASPFTCVDTLYASEGSAVYSMNPATGAMTAVTGGTYTETVNALAVSPGGESAYVMGAANGSGVSNLYKVGTAAVQKTVSGLRAGAVIVAGAFNPATGDYWIGQTNSGATMLNLYRIDVSSTSTSVSVTPEVTIAKGVSGTLSTDMAFDSQGNLYVVASSVTGDENKLFRLSSGALALGGTQTPVTVTTLTAGGFPGIAFGSDGYIYVQGGASLQKLKPTNGTTAGASVATKLGGTDKSNGDLGSCATPAVFDTVVKDVVSRKNPTDQFTVSLTGDLSTSANTTGTTAGTDTGLQIQPGEFAGPSLVLPGTAYDFDEVGAKSANAPAGTDKANLNDYISTYACVNNNTGVVIASGTGTSGKLTVPPSSSAGTGASVTCTITNEVKSPAITLTKTASGTPTKAGDTITYAFVAKNTGNVPLSSVAISDPLLTGKTITCASTTLAAGASTNCSVSSAYAVTQADVNAGTVANTATVSGTPTGMTTVTATSSTATAITRAAQLKIVKSASGTPAAAGDKITYTFTVTNTGNTPVSGVGVNDPLVTGEVCSPTTLAPGASASCTANQYTVTQADVNAGTVNNTAAVVGSGPSGTTLTTDSTSSASTVTPLTRTPQLKIAKSASGTPTKAGDKITYSFTVTNTGNTTVTGVGVNDPLVTGEVCSPTTLAPGASASCTANQYTVVQGDVDAGTVVNTATPTGTGPSGAATVTVDPSSTGQTTTPITAAGQVDVTLAQSSAAITTAGQTISYTYSVQNTGNVSLTNLAVTDSLDNTLTCPTTSLAPGASTTCTSTYTVTQADVEAGKVLNTASGTARTPANVAVTDASAQVEKTIAANAQLTTTLAASGSPTKKGDEITYTSTVENTGNVTVDTLEVTDTLGNTITCDVATLAPGESATCTATYEVTQADVDAGEVVNTATAEGMDPKDTAVVDDSAEVEKTIAAAGSVAIALTQSAATVTGAGDGILYFYAVENTGNVTLNDVEVTDALGTTISCATTIAPGATILCTSTYEVTQGDVDGGRVDNTAAVTATPTRGADVEGDSTTVTKLIAADPELTTTLVPAGAPTGKGDEITYTATVENTGNVTVDHLVVTDDLGNTYTCDVTSLAPGDSAECTAAYPVTQADVDAGEVVNTAAGAGLDPSEDPVSDPSVEVTTTITQRPELSSTLLDSGTPSKAGDPITYTMTVDNIGNVTVDDLVVTDDLGNTYTCDVTELAPGERAECVATYPVTQADVDAGLVENDGSVRGDDPKGYPVTATANDVDTTIPADAELTTTLVPSGSPTKKGDEIIWTATVENTGNVTVDHVVVTDDLGNTYVCDVTELAPGASATCTATDAVTQAEVNVGEVVNTATGAGADPSDDDVSDESPVATVTIAPGAALTATLDQSTTAVTKKGDEITYAYAVENTGNVTVDHLVVTDVLGNTLVCDATELAPGETADCSATYPVTQADVDAAEVENTATAAGLTPAAAPVTGDSNTVSKPIVAAAALTTTLDSSGTPTKKGDEIVYTVTVENTGNVTMDHLVVTDELGNTYVCDVTELAPGEEATCTATYPVTQADVDAGEVDNTATGGGESPSGAPVTDVSGPDTTPIPADPELTTTLVPSGTPEKAGDEIVYTVTVENTGNVTVDHFVVTDELGNTYVCDVTELAPGEEATCTATYPVTQADVDAGEVENTATGSGDDPSGDPVVDASPESVVPIVADPELTITEASVGALVDVDHDGRDSAGDTVVYTYEVQNTGNVTLTDAKVTDTLGNVLACVPGTLAPGATATCASVPVPVTQTQVDAGSAETRGTAAGTPPVGAPVESGQSGLLVTPLTPVSDLAVVTRIGSWTDVNGDGKLNAGDLVFYAFDVTNGGTATFDGVTVEDERLAGQRIAIECPAPLTGLAGSASSVGGPTLAPGQATTCVGTQGYVVTADDVQERIIENSAEADAVVRGTSAPISATSNIVTSVPVASPKLTLTTEVDVKDTNGNGRTDAGDEVTYSYTVTNDGDVRLENITVTDPHLAEQGITITCTPSTLAPGESATCTTSAPYVITDEDVENGTIASDAVARGEDPVSGVSAGVESNQVESVVETQPAPAQDVTEDREEPRTGALADAGGPAAAAGALGVMALGLGLGLVGAARRRRMDEAA